MAHRLTKRQKHRGQGRQADGKGKGDRQTERETGIRKGRQANEQTSSLDDKPAFSAVTKRQIQTYIAYESPTVPQIQKQTRTTRVS